MGGFRGAVSDCKNHNSPPPLRRAGSQFTADPVTEFCCSRSRGKTMSNPVCPKTGAPMRRGVRPMTLEYNGARATFDMPGWYCEKSDESIHTGEDMKMSDRALNRLKAATEGLPLPEEIKRIRTKLGLTQEEAGER